MTRILERSLCARDRQDELELKPRLPETAAVLGLRIPAQIIEPDWAQAMDFATLHGAPVVVKLDRNRSGAGVRVCGDETALQTVASSGVVEIRPLPPRPGCPCNGLAP